MTLREAFSVIRAADTLARFFATDAAMLMVSKAAKEEGQRGKNVLKFLLRGFQ